MKKTLLALVFALVVTVPCAAGDIPGGKTPPPPPPDTTSTTSPSTTSTSTALIELIVSLIVKS